MNKLKTNLTLLLITFLSFSCTKEAIEIPCNQVWERVESNRTEAGYHCQGLANDYPELMVLSNKLISMNCDQYQEGVSIEKYIFCELVVTEKTTIYKI